MRFDVDYIDINQYSHTKTFEISALAFAKHAVTCGKGDFESMFSSWLKAIGLIFNNLDYFSFNRLNFRHFRRESLEIYDPTSATRFSNIVGCGVADFLCKNLLSATYVLGYEAAMLKNGIKISGRRPDFYGITRSRQQFSLEAKGRSDRSISDAEMLIVKDQSKSGPLNKHFTVASVTYNIYEKLACRFHDPINPDAIFNDELNSSLISSYYSELSAFLDRYLIRTGAEEIGGKHYYSFEFEPDYIYPIYFNSIMSSLRILIAVESYRGDRIEPLLEPFIENNIYIDVDRIGLMIS